MPASDGPSNQPIRLFKSDVLEFFSHVRPITVLVLWSPVALVFLVESLWRAGSYRAAAQAAFGVLAG